MRAIRKSECHTDCETYRKNIWIEKHMGKNMDLNIWIEKHIWKKIEAKMRAIRK